MAQSKIPDYSGSIRWAHNELDTYGAPRTSGGFTLTVAGRIAELAEMKNQRIRRLQEENITMRKTLVVAEQALQSYAHGNQSQEFAARIANRIQELLEREAPND